MPGGVAGGWLPAEGVAAYGRKFHVETCRDTSLHEIIPPIAAQGEASPLKDDRLAVCLAILRYL